MALTEPVVSADPERLADPLCSKGRAVVTAATLNVRTGPGPAYAVCGQLAAGAVVAVWMVGTEAAGGNWYWIQARDVPLPQNAALRLTGWCSAAWLKVAEALLA